MKTAPLLRSRPWTSSAYSNTSAISSTWSRQSLPFSAAICLTCPTCHRQRRGQRHRPSKNAATVPGSRHPSPVFSWASTSPQRGSSRTAAPAVNSTFFGGLGPVAAQVSGQLLSGGFQLRGLAETGLAPAQAPLPRQGKPGGFPALSHTKATGKGRKIFFVNGQGRRRRA